WARRDQVGGRIAALPEDGGAPIPVAHTPAWPAKPADPPADGTAGTDLQMSELERTPATVVAGLGDQLLGVRRTAPGTRAARRLRAHGRASSHVRGLLGDCTSGYPSSDRSHRER